MLAFLLAGGDDEPGGDVTQAHLLAPEVKRHGEHRIVGDGRAADRLAPGAGRLVALEGAIADVLAFHGWVVRALKVAGFRQMGHQPEPCGVVLGGHPAPARPGDDAAICADCAGFSQSFACARCGFEGKLHGGRLCTRCALADRLADLLDDGSGRIRPELVPLADCLLAMDNPLSGLTWLYARKGRTGSAGDLLRRLGRGEIELTHEAFNALQPCRAAAHLRDLLMACGVLPAADKQICAFERWLAGHLASITGDGHAQLIRRFATWEVLPRLRARAEKKPVTPAARCHAVDQVLRATAFLHWLSERGLTLPDCRQADIDAWYAENNGHARITIRAFLQWCMTGKLTGRFRLPPTVISNAAALPGHERVSQLGRILTAHDLPLRTRVAATIVLLYAQPISRIVRLTLHDVIRDGDQVLLRLGEPPTPVPGPVADLLLSWIGSRNNINTATNRNSPWLFPGRRAGQPMRPDYLAALVRDIGIPTTAGRASAIRQHVLEMPAPVATIARRSTPAVCRDCRTDHRSVSRLLLTIYKCVGTPRVQSSARAVQCACRCAAATLRRIGHRRQPTHRRKRMILHDVRVHPSKDNLKREDQLAWKIAVRRRRQGARWRRTSPR